MAPPTRPYWDDPVDAASVCWPWQERVRGPWERRGRTTSAENSVEGAGEHIVSGGASRGADARLQMRDSPERYDGRSGSSLSESPCVSGQEVQDVDIPGGHAAVGAQDNTGTTMRSSTRTPDAGPQFPCSRRAHSRVSRASRVRPPVTVWPSEHLPPRAFQAHWRCAPVSAAGTSPVGTFRLGCLGFTNIAFTTFRIAASCPSSWVSLVPIG